MRAHLPARRLATQLSVSLRFQGVAPMRQVALALSFCRPALPAPPRRSSSRRSTASRRPTPRPTRIPAARDIPFPGTMQLTVDATDVTRGIFTDPRARAGRRRPAISCCSIPSGCRAVTARAARSTRSRASASRANGQRAQVGARHARRLRLPRRPCRRASPRSTSSSNIVSPTAGNQGRIVATPGHGEHPVAVANSLYPAGYYVRAHPGPGVGDRAHRLEGRDRASAERADRRPDRLSGRPATRS